ncbi:threonine synthase [Haliovirga abyssi]|uniref:Threonine synthase n=1 Tax=Haliovirga abyssi TaxID=2996794 RepID=A0AAU9D302_9FUSO|nr:threonine synthase [Haliovirga abyssi]BDU50351.1 threonine synthase [Haliovirga abyssi]
MKYISTRGNYKKVNSAEAIKLGMVPEGGLFVPESIPKLNLEDLKNISKENYQEIAKKILSLFLTDFDSKEISEIVNNSYGENFDTKDVTPLVKIKDNLYILELWHGPTAAFKDMALQMLPHLMLKSKEKVGTDKTTLILVATSGDTGKAALEGFKDIDGIEIIVFFPEEGVSKVQELQMRTTTGINTKVIGINGNFDDCQTGVKNIFSDKILATELAKKGYELSSANSINWGRLLPQIIYYFKAYFELVNNDKIKIGEKVNFSVPTGNFGNILAGYYAKEIGLPVNKFICASNKNKVLSDFINTGEYNKNRDFYKTMSPSMDILISSNLERFLFEITGHNSEKIDNWYKELNKTGKFNVDDETKNKINKIMVAGFASEDETEETISKIYSETNYLLDTHTAVGVKVVNNYNLDGKTIVDSTANPYKFTGNVLKALTGESEKDEFVAIDKLNEKTKVEIHRAVKGLDKKEILHNETIRKDEMKDVVVKSVK